MRQQARPGKRLAAAVLALAVAAAHGSDADRCHRLYRLTDISQAIEPGIPVAPTESLPAHCRVRGVINRAIRFEVTLPDAWSGRMMFTAPGGAAGRIGDTRSLLPRGFAMASTDTGHELAEGNGFMRQPEAVIDYAYRAVHLVTQAAKRVIARYYGREVEYSYLRGCSNGGRAALLEAERFPADYDGIIAGAPGFRFSELLTWILAIDELQRAHPLDPDALALLDQASRTACDAIDGVTDGVINDPRVCQVDVEALVCTNGREDGCLTVGQAQTARLVYGGIVDEDGNTLSPGVLPGAESFGDWSTWLLADERVGLTAADDFREALGILMRHEPDFDAAAFDPSRDRTRIASRFAQFDTTGDLGDYRDRGGKILMYQGWNDFPLRPQHAIDYLAGLDEATGGANRTADFTRLFMVPGMVHCGRGPGAWHADYVDPIVKWAEEGEAPERIVAKRPADPTPRSHADPGRWPEGMPAITRPLCVYPKLAQYDGEGDPDDEQSFRCAVP